MDIKIFIENQQEGIDIAHCIITVCCNAYPENKKRVIFKINKVHNCHCRGLYKAGKISLKITEVRFWR
jgi:hypothetical protein